MNYRDKIISVALSQLGYTEGKNNDTKYGNWYGLPNQPWCAMFISWCANQSGIPKEIIKPFAYCPSGFNWFNNKKEATRNHIKPQKGDIIFFIWSGTSTPDHVGLVEYVEGNTVHTIEGNRSDRVGRFSYNINSKEIFGYGKPNYSEDVKPTPTGSDKIRQVQEWLNNNYGTGLKVDGLYGSQTKKALVKALQTELNKQFNANLSVDGIFGTETKNKCVKVGKGAKGNITRILQALLICKGYNLKFDGDFGNDTQDKVIEFQRNHSLKVDGIAGGNTFEKLFKI